MSAVLEVPNFCDAAVRDSGEKISRWMLHQQGGIGLPTETVKIFYSESHQAGREGAAECLSRLMLRQAQQGLATLVMLPPAPRLAGCDGLGCRLT